MQVNGLAKAQRDVGHEVHVFTATRLPSAAHEVLEDGITLHRLTFPLPADLPLHPRAQRVISEALAQIKPDVVHVHVGSVSFFAWSGIQAAHKAHLPVLTTVHSMWGPLAKRMYGVANRALGWSRWTALSAVSEAAAAPVRQAAQADVLVTGNGVDLSGWTPRDERHGRRFHVVSATRFAPRKRVLPLITIAANLHRLLGDNAPRFTIAGSGPALERARQRIKKAGLDGVVVLPGRLSRAALADLYATGDVFVQLSVRESFGLAAIEARAAGLPVLGRAGTGFTEFITPGTDGYLERSDSAVQARLVQLLEHPERLQEMRDFAATHSPRNAWSYALEQIEIGYHQAQAQRLR